MSVNTTRSINNVNLFFNEKKNELLDNSLIIHNIVKIMSNYSVSVALATYGTLAPGMELHVKFVEEFLRKISVSHLFTHSFLARLSQGWFRSFIHELGAVTCTRN